MTGLTSKIIVIQRGVNKLWYRRDSKHNQSIEVATGKIKNFIINHTVSLNNLTVKNLLQKVK